MSGLLACLSVCCVRLAMCVITEANIGFTLISPILILQDGRALMQALSTTCICVISLVFNVFLNIPLTSDVFTVKICGGYNNRSEDLSRKMSSRSSIVK